MHKACAAACPSICGMVSDQGEKTFSSYFLDLLIKIGKDVRTVKKKCCKIRRRKSDCENGESKGKKNGHVAEHELQAHQVGGGTGRETGYKETALEWNPSSSFQKRHFSETCKKTKIKLANITLLF